MLHPVAQDLLPTIALWGLPADCDEVVAHTDRIDLTRLARLVWRDNRFIIDASSLQADGLIVFKPLTN